MRKFPKSLEIAAESVSFLLVQYFLACFMLSMRAGFVYIIIFAANVFVFIKYGETLARLTDNRMLRAVIFAAYLAALAASVYFFGYFPVSPERADAAVSRNDTKGRKSRAFPADARLFLYRALRAAARRKRAKPALRPAFAAVTLSLHFVHTSLTAPDYTFNHKILGGVAMKKVLTAMVATLVLAAASAAMAAPIVMDGSTTVLPFGQAAVEQYMKEHQGVQFSVSGTGTGNGFKSLADGAAQIANASRFIKDSEIQNCISKKVYPVPFAVALDCIVPIVHKDNKVADLTKAQLKDIFAGKITNWKEVGGADAPIVVVGRDTSSGTYGTWQEMIMDSGEKTRVTAKAQVTASSGAMLATVSKNPNAIGYEGMGYVNDTVKGLKVEGVAASAATARNGQYPLSRFLYMFTNGWPQGEVLNFLMYMQSDAGQKIVNSTGYVSLREVK